MQLNTRQKDGIVVFLGVCISYGLSFGLNLAEELNESLSKYEHLQLDEIPPTLFALAVLSLWFAIRRNKELSEETRQRKQIAAQLTRSEQLYKTLFDSSLTGNCVANLQGEILMANQAFSSICNLANRSQSLQTVLNFDWDETIEQLKTRQVLHFGRLIVHRTDQAPAYTIARLLYISPGYQFDDQQQMEPQIHIYLVDVTKQYLAEQNIEKALKENQYLARHAINIQEKERKYIAQEIHDETGQYLTAIRMDALTLQTADKQKSINIAERIASNTQHVQRSIHELIKQLRPVILDSQGLSTAISQLVQDWQQLHPQIAVTLDLGVNDEPLSEDVNIVTYRVLQESLTNISKHANATQTSVTATIDIDQQKPFLQLVIQDNGNGIDNSRKGGLGLIGMRERVESVGGTFAIDSQTNNGTVIQAQIPIIFPAHTQPTYTGVRA